MPPGAGTRHDPVSVARWLQKMKACRDGGGYVGHPQCEHCPTCWLRFPQEKKAKGLAPWEEEMEQTRFNGVIHKRDWKCKCLAAILAKKLLCLHCGYCFLCAQPDPCVRWAGEYWLMPQLTCLGDIHVPRVNVVESQYCFSMRLVHTGRENSAPCVPT